VCSWSFYDAWTSHGHTQIHKCYNPSLGVTTKVRACKGAGQEWNPRVTFHVIGSVGKCEGMNPHTPKWAPTLGIGVPMDFRIFKRKLQGLKFIRLKRLYTIENFLRLRCLKCACITHLDIYNISYGQKKG